MLKQILYTLFLAFVYTGYSQTVKFSYQYGTTGGNLSYNLFTVDSKYILMGSTSNTLTNQYQGLGYALTNSLGGLEIYKEIFHPNGNGFYSNGTGGIFTQQFNEYIVFNGVISVGLDHTKATLIKFNMQTGDTLWMKTYSQPGDSTHIYTSSYLADSSIIAFGRRYYELGTNYYSKPFMMKVDKNGNYKWHKYINNNFSSTNYCFQKILKQSDNDFIVLGYKSSNICYPQSFVMRIDTNAIKQYEINFTGIQNPVVNDAITLQDGNILAIGGYNAINNCGTAFYSKAKKFAYKLNPATGVKIASKTYNLPANADGAVSVQQHSNSVIYVGGCTTTTYTPNSVDYYADVLKLNNNLDSLTTISFEDAGNDYSFNTNQLLVTPDGGFAACLSNYPNSGSSKFWLIKADSNGCYTSTCSTVGFAPVTKAIEAQVKIYPNPANEILNFELEIMNEIMQKNNFELAVLNTLGQVIKEEELVQTNSDSYRKEINVKNLSAGIYFLQVKREGRVLVNKKFVIEK